jgi:hypothetical protein
MSFTLVTTSRSLHRSHMSGRTHALSIGTDLRAPQPGSAAIKTTSAVDCTGSAWSIQFQFVRAFARTPGATAQNPCRWLVLGTLYFCLSAARRRHRGPPGQSRSLKPTESNWDPRQLLYYRGGIKTRTSASSTAKVALQKQQRPRARDDEELSFTRISNLLSS